MDEGEKEQNNPDPVDSGGELEDAHLEDSFHDEPEDEKDDKQEGTDIHLGAQHSRNISTTSNNILITYRKTGGAWRMFGIFDLFSFMFSSANNFLAILSLAQILSVAASNMNLSV